MSHNDRNCGGVLPPPLYALLSRNAPPEHVPAARRAVALRAMKSAWWSNHELANRFEHKLADGPNAVISDLQITPSLAISGVSAISFHLELLRYLWIGPPQNAQ